MDRITPPASRAVSEAERNAAKPRRRWGDGPNFPWASHTEPDWTISAQWPQVCAVLSEQVASEANAMRRELKRLHADGRIARTDAAGLDALARSVRSAGVTAQKLVRLAAGTIKLRPEPVDLT